MKKRILSIICLTALIAMAIFLQACAAEATSDFEVVSLDVAPAQVVPDEKVTVRAEVKNDSDEATKYNVPLMVNGVAESRRSLALAPGASETVEFSLSRSEPGAYEIAIGQRKATILVEELVPASFKVSELKVEPAQANLLEEIVITAVVANTGGVQGTYVAELKVNSATEKTEKLTLDAGTACNMAFKISRNTPGTYTVTLGELSGKFVVLEPVRPIQIDNPTCPPPEPGSRRFSCCG